MLKAFLILVSLSGIAQAAPAPRKMTCVCCAYSEGPLLGGGYGAYCGAGGGPSTVTFSATPDTYEAIGERLCRQGMVDQSQRIYVSDCGYVN